MAAPEQTDADRRRPLSVCSAQWTGLLLPGEFSRAILQTYGGSVKFRTELSFFRRARPSRLSNIAIPALTATTVLYNKDILEGANHPHLHLCQLRTRPPACCEASSSPSFSAVAHALSAWLSASLAWIDQDCKAHRAVQVRCQHRGNYELSQSNLVEEYSSG